ncbi:uncharacterized protein EI97DRAFT_32459 [Westerdykella ornata]|uniref:LITAF domain-containing protein n=1 Tax=Westerdykella ornata TaxID=318751 RepID=A0A6A6JY63_WESOR|nr:uncharacterized protein EI97DRAFT_32459 [Westerdykella ornata]KAF2281542.1 hypothetical protein EI97DRAFT_32459 [Westerdykella ornata]
MEKSSAPAPAPAPATPSHPQAPPPIYEQQSTKMASPPQPIPMHPGPLGPQSAYHQAFQTATPLMALNRGPAPADCPACGCRSMTTVQFETGNTTHVWALALCIFTCLGCIPYCMNSLKDVEHRCGNCGVLLATWHRGGGTEVHCHV